MTNHSAAPAAPHSADALKPCPFCGCDDIRVHLDWSMMCANCGAEGALMDTQDAAIAAWNRRPTPADCESKTGEWSACQLRTIELYNMIHNRRPLNAERINTTPASPGLDNEAAARLRKQAEEAKKVRGVVALSPEDAFALLDRLERAEADAKHYSMGADAEAKSADEWRERALRAEAAAGAVPEGFKLVPITEMQGDTARQWAWDQVRRDCDDSNWTVGESGTYYGFFLHGWHYRKQYESQLAAPPAQGLPAAPDDVLDAKRHRYTRATTTAIRDPETGERIEITPEMYDAAIDRAMARDPDAKLGIKAKDIPAAAPSEAKPFAAPGKWFPTGVLGHPMREYEPGKWESANWPSEAHLFAAAPTGEAKPVAWRRAIWGSGRWLFTDDQPTEELAWEPLFATPPAQDAGTGDATIVAIGYESGFMATDPDHDGATVKLHYRDEATAEAAFCAITRIIDRAIANSGRTE